MRRALSLLVFGVVRLVELFARSLTPGALPRVAGAAGRLWFAVDGRRRARALENLRVAYGATLDEGARRELARRSLGELLRVPLEVLAQPRFVRNRAELLRRVHATGDYEQFRRDVAAGTGGLLVTGHLGNWEMAARALVLSGVPARVVMRPLENPFLDAYIVRTRGGGARVLPKFGAARGTFEAVHARQWVALLADQNAGRGGRFVPFFGLAASTHPLAAVVALREGAPMYACACRRLPGRPWQFQLHMRRLHPSADHPAQAPEELLARFTAALEDWVRLDPAQYNWIHRRWKSRPAGEEPGPQLPSYAVPRHLDFTSPPPGSI